ncbi:kelch repeat protein [Cooperia oncophora]
MSVERLDPEETTPAWQSVCPMSRQREGVGVGVLNNFLYAVGGFHGEPLNSTERYCANLTATNI